MFTTQPILEPKVVLLVSGGRMPLDSSAGGWAFAVGAATSPSGERLFTSVHHLVPEHIASRDIPAAIKKPFAEELRSAGIPEEAVQLNLERMSFDTVPTLTVESLLRQIESLPERSAVSISCTDIYRSLAASPPAPQSPIEAWSGINYRTHTRKALLLPHITALLKGCITVADRRDLFITLLYEDYLGLEDFDGELTACNNFAAVSLYQTPPGEGAMEAVEKWMRERTPEHFTAAIQQIRGSDLPEQQRLMLEAQLHFAAGDSPAAWDLLKTHLRHSTFSLPENALTVSNIALEAGDTTSAQHWLRTALSAGLDALEDLLCARLVASKLDLSPEEQQIEDRIVQLFPDHQTALQIQYDRHFLKREFATAATLAEKLNDQFQIHLCNTFKEAEINCTHLLKYAEAAGKLENAHIAVAYEMQRRGKHQEAAEWARKIPATSRLCSKALRIRIRSFAHLQHEDADAKEARFTELRHILQAAAENHSDLLLRFAIEALFEEHLGDLKTIAVLLPILNESLAAQTHSISERKITPRAPESELEPAEDARQQMENFKRFLNSLTGHAFVFAKGNLDPQVADHVNQQTQEFLHYLVGRTHPKDQQDIAFLTQALHFAVLAAKYLRDPNADFEAIITAIAHCAQSGMNQKARDFAETALRLLPTTQPASIQLRTGLGWLCYAEAFQRTGNAIAALRCLTCASLCWSCQQPSLPLYFRALRLRTLVLRDLHLTELTAPSLQSERTLAEQLNLYAQHEEQFIQVEATIALTTDLSSQQALQLLRRIDALLATPREEIAPLLSCSANLIARLHSLNAAVPPDISQHFEERLQHVAQPVRTLLATLAHLAPTPESLTQVVDQLAGASSLSDLAFDVRHLGPLAHAGISSACKTKNLEHFGLALACLSQPVLTLEAASQDVSAQVQQHTQLQDWFFQSTATPTDAAIKSALKISENIGQPKPNRVSAAARFSLTDLQAAIQGSETVLLLATDSAHRLCRADVKKTGTDGPQQLPISTWSPSAFVEWKHRYPHDYGNWEPAPFPLDPEKVPVSQVIASVKDLHIAPLTGETVTIIPESQLFGFPFVLCQEGVGNTVHDTQLATAPSTTWLVWNRREPFVGDGVWRAWLGSPRAGDMTINFLRSKLRPFLSQHGVQEITDEKPAGLKNSNVAIVVSHGKLGWGNRFSAVTDNSVVFSPQEITSHLADAGCVVFFVCHAGKSDLRLGSLETAGLASEMLKGKARAVIASPWSLHIDVAVLWLPVFLQHLREGSSVGKALHAAAQTVRAQFANPCAWAALQLFGDPCFIPEPKATPAA